MCACEAVRVGRAGRIVVGLAVAIVLVLVLAQLLLPAIAAERVRARVGKYGTVESVSVKAWPAVKLLWGQRGLGDACARGALQLSPQQAVKLLLASPRGEEDDAPLPPASERVRCSCTMRAFRSTADALQARAWAARADVTAALGKGFEVQLLNSGGGQVEVRVSGGLFGVGASRRRGGTRAGRQAGGAPAGLLAGFAAADAVRQPARARRRRGRARRCGPPAAWRAMS